MTWRLGGLRTPPSLARLHYVIDAFIEAASEMTPLRILLMMAVASWQAGRITWSSRVFLGSPSGWILLMITFPIALAVVLVDLFRKDGNLTDRAMPVVRKKVTEWIEACDRDLVGRH